MSQYVPCYNHLQSFQGRKRWHLSQVGADLCYVDGWGALIGEHCVERCLDVCTLQAHISHPLPCLQYKTMLSHEDDKQRVRRVCKNVSVRTFSTIIHLIKLESFQGRKRWHLSHAVWGALIGEHCVERCLDVCTPSTHQSSITLPSIQDNTFS